MFRKLLGLCIVATLAWVGPARPAQATALFQKKFEARYAGDGAPKDFVATIKKVKCNVCHVDGKKKEVVNTFGEALHRVGLTKEAFPRQRVDEEPEQVEKEILDFLEKGLGEKSPSGETYGERIRAGKLPLEP